MIVQTVALLSIILKSLVNAGPHQSLETGMVEASPLDSTQKMWGATCAKQSYLGGRWSLGFTAGVNQGEEPWDLDTCLFKHLGD